MTGLTPSRRLPFWLAWGLAFLGFPVGGLASLAVVGGVETGLEGALGGAAAGGVIGLAQWLALRGRAAVSALWVLATALGLAGGLALGVALLGTGTEGSILPLRGAVAGFGVGAAQWLVLRRTARGALLWVPAVSLAWAVGWGVTRAAGVDLAPGFAVFGSTGAWAFQLLTGLALGWLLRRPV